MYNHVARADIIKLYPLNPRLFDYVASVDVLGQIPFHEKNYCLIKIVRILKNH